ncbi:uncharacterized protein [Salminus brasiliensis]|uniref:uncharacterized protein n=1 Tax=Salminus brasiliensis TaxID=930266 RepID=UPI003B837916
MARRRAKSSSSKQDDPLLMLEPQVGQSRGIKEYVLPCALFFIILLGGSMLGWFCSQQQQAIEDLSEALTTMQTRVTKLQQQLGSGNAQLASVGGFEERLLALEEAYAKAQRQAEVALAASEQIKSKDLQNKVWALQTEMNSKLAELQQNSISIASLNAIIKNKSDEFEAVKQSVNTILGANSELAVSLSGLTSTLSVTESRLGEHVSVVDGLKSQLEGQKREISEMKESFTSSQEEIASNVQELIEIRERMQLEQVKRTQAFKEQLKTLHKKLEDHQTSTNSLHSQLTAQLKAVQTQFLPGAPREEVQVGEQANTAHEEEQADITDHKKKASKKEAEHAEEKHTDKVKDKTLSGAKKDKVREAREIIKERGAREKEEVSEEQRAKEEDDVSEERKVEEQEKVTEKQGAEAEENVRKEAEAEEEDGLTEKHKVTAGEEEHQASEGNEEHKKKPVAEEIETSSAVSDLPTNQTEETDLTETEQDEQTEETVADETEMDTLDESPSLPEETDVNANEIEEVFAEEQVEESSSLSNDVHREKTEAEENGAGEEESEAVAEKIQADGGTNDTEGTDVETSEEQEGDSAQAEIEHDPVEDLPEESAKE